jgi:hypothetical protein
VTFDVRPFMIEFAQGKVPKENLARFAASYCYQVDNFSGSWRRCTRTPNPATSGFERDPAKVLDDVLDEYVSREAAEHDYGVILTGELVDYSLEVDHEATHRRREELRAERERASGNGEDS